MNVLTTEMLEEEIRNRALQQNGAGFTVTKELGTVSVREGEDGSRVLVAGKAASEEIEHSAEAIRALGKQIPELKITYPQTVLSEEKETRGDASYTVITSRTDAAIEVPESLSAQYSGAEFRRLMASDWSEQTGRLAAEIAANLQKYEFRTERLFGTDDNAATAVFRVTAETAESDIWLLPIDRCGLYPLAWDQEVCGLSVLLAQRLKESLADACKELCSITVRRDPAQQSCLVTVQYVI